MSTFDQYEVSTVLATTNERYEENIERTGSVSEWETTTNNTIANRKRHPTGILKKPKSEDSSGAVTYFEKCNYSDLERMDNVSPANLSSFLQSPAPQFQQNTPESIIQATSDLVEKELANIRHEEQALEKKEEDAAIQGFMSGEDKEIGSTWVVSARVRHRSNIDSYDSSQLDSSTDCNNCESFIGSVINASSDPVLISSTDVFETDENRQKTDLGSDQISDQIKSTPKKEEIFSSVDCKSQFKFEEAETNTSSHSLSQKSKQQEPINIPRKLEAEIPKSTSITSKGKNDESSTALHSDSIHSLSQKEKSIANFKQWYPNSYFAPLGRQYLHQSQENISSTNKNLTQVRSRPSQCYIKDNNTFSTVLNSERTQKPPRPQLPRAQSFTSLEENKNADFIDYRHKNDFDGSSTQFINRTQNANDYNPVPNVPKRRMRHKSMADLNQYKKQMEYVRDDCSYNYDNSMPYRSSTVSRYQHRSQADSFLPPQGIPQYAPRIECKKAVPPERRKSISDKIFDEYQEKLAERIERKTNSTLRLNKPKQELEKEPEDYGVLLQLQKEFMGRVQEKKLCPGSPFEDPLESRITMSNYKIEGNAEKLNDAIVDDVRNLLEVDDSIKLKPQLKDSLYRNHLRNAVHRAAIRDRNYNENDIYDKLSRDYTNRLDMYRSNDIDGCSYRASHSRYEDHDYDFRSGSLYDYYDTSDSLSRYQTMSPTLNMLRNKKSKIFPKATKYHPVSNTMLFAAPNEKIYNVKREYEQELDGKIRKFFDLTRIPIKGVGPTTSFGMPTSLKTTVDERHRPDWYRKMFGSMHQGTRKGEDLVDGVLERWRILGQESSTDSESEVQLYSSLRNPRFKNQPRRIENYRPGRCSLSAKEAETENIRTPYTLIQQKMLEKNARLNKSASADGKTTRHRSATPTNDSRFRSSRSKSPSVSCHQRNDLDNANIVYHQRSHIDKTCATTNHKFSDGKYSENILNMSPKIEQSEHRSEKLHGNQRDRTVSPAVSFKSLPDTDHSIDVNDGPTRDKTVTFAEPKMRVIHSFQPIKRGELELRRGDMVTVHGKVNDHWYYGEIDGRCGLFPTNYVGQVSSKEIAKPLTPTLTRAVAAHDFQGRSQVELTFKKGDTLTITRKVDDNWYEGRLEDKVGIIPVMYLEIEK